MARVGIGRGVQVIARVAIVSYTLWKRFICGLDDRSRSTQVGGG